jgi:hypothetical protein
VVGQICVSSRISSLQNLSKDGKKRGKKAE